jgi:hypothetical protein
MTYLFSAIPAWLLLGQGLLIVGMLIGQIIDGT